MQPKDHFLLQLPAQLLHQHLCHPVVPHLVLLTDQLHLLLHCHWQDWCLQNVSVVMRLHWLLDGMVTMHMQAYQLLN